MDIHHYLERQQDLSPRCAICRHPEIKADLEVYVRAHQERRTSDSPHRIWREYIFPKYKFPRSANTIRQHIRNCLGYAYEARRDSDE